MRPALKIICLLMIALIPEARAGTVNLIANGGFESGLASWTAAKTPFQYITNSCDDGFASQTTAAGCVAGVNPTSGHAAYSSTTFPNVQNQTGQWTNTLSQNFVVPTNVALTNALLSWVDSVVYSGSGSYRGVDVLVQLYAGSTLLATKTVVQNPSSNGTISWTANSLDVTSILSTREGQTLTLQLSSIVSFETQTAPKSTATNVNTGFDNVQLMVTEAVPEPPTVMLMAGVLALGVVVRRRPTNKRLLQRSSLAS